MNSINLLILLVFIVSSTLATGPFHWSDTSGGRVRTALRCDFYGGDFDRAYIHVNGCGDRCADNKHCTHFTYLDNEGVCLLKHFESNAKASDLNQPGLCGWVIRRK